MNSTPKRPNELFLLTATSVFFATTVPIGYSTGHLLKQLTLAQFLALVAGVYFIWQYSLINLRLLRSLRPFFLTIGLYCGWLFFSSMTSPYSNRILATSSWFRQILIPLTLSLGIVLAARTNFEKTYVLFKKTLICSGVVFLIAGIFEKYFTHFFRDYILSEFRFKDSLQVYFFHRFYTPAAGLFEHFNAFAVNQALCMVLVFADLLERISQNSFLTYRELFKRLRSKEHLIRLILIFGFTFGMIIATSKTGLLASLGGSATLFIFYRKRLKLTRKLLVTCIVAFGTAVSIFYLAHPDSRSRALIALDPLFQVWQPTDPNHPIPFHEGLVQTLRLGLYGRDEIFKYSFELFLDHPVRGIGFNQTAHAFFATGKPIHAVHSHNIFLMELVAGGMIGFLMFLILMIYPHYRVSSRTAASPAYQAITALQVTFLFGQMTESFLETLFWYAVFYFVLVKFLWVLCFSNPPSNGITDSET